MRTHDYIEKIENEFLKYYEKTVDSLRELHPQYGEMTDSAVIKMQDDFLTAELKLGGGFDYAELPEKLCAEYDKALVQQLYYILTAGDFLHMSGYDSSANSFANLDELEKRYMAPMAKLTLAAAGLLGSDKEVR